MRIAYIPAGAGSLRCGACAHDYLLISALRHLAHDVSVLPLYTPLHSDLGDLHGDSGVFLGGISAYLRVQHPRLARSLRPLRSLLDSEKVLNLATRRMIQTEPSHLGELTVSFLEGVNGPHAQEIRRLARTVAAMKPDVVFLANSLLCSLAPAIRERVEVPVCCGFLGEDSFVMDLPEPHRSTAIQLLREHATSLGRVICPSNAGLQQASLLLLLPGEKFVVVPAPVDLAIYTPGRTPHSGPPVIGHLSVMRPSKGLDLLLRALQQVGDRYASPIHVLIAGQVVDRDFLRQMRRFAAGLPSHIRYRFVGEVSLEQKLALLRMCDVTVCPSLVPEVRAMAAMEAMACAGTSNRPCARCVS